MDTITHIAPLLVEPILLAIAVIYVYGFVARVSLNARFRNVLMGATFGLGAMLAMIAPVVLAEGVIIDMRNLLIGISGAFFGILGGAITLIIAVATRVSIGGEGAMAGVIGIALSWSAGVIWAKCVRGKMRRPSHDSIILGLGISAHLFSAALLPADVFWRFMTEIAPTLVIFNLIGAILIGALIAREEALIAENEMLVNAASKDPLTRLHNRRSAMQAYDDLPEQQKASHGTAMLCLDVDNFKSVNDSYGHLFGDAVLSEISMRIGRTLRPTDIFSRLGGDEFLIILPNVTLDETHAIAERCRAIIAQDVVHHADKLAAVTISIGAEWLPARPDFVTFVARADEALYHAKNLGRNCVALAWKSAAMSQQVLKEPPHQRSA